MHFYIFDGIVKEKKIWYNKENLCLKQLLLVE